MWTSSANVRVLQIYTIIILFVAIHILRYIALYSYDMPSKETIMCVCETKEQHKDNKTRLRDGIKRFITQF